jgi:hypothetical protein
MRLNPRRRLPMTAPAELQKAIFAALEADQALTALLGTGRIFAQAPANVAFPHITYGRTSIYDWSTNTEKGNEHLFTLHIWSKAKGNKEALEIMEIARARLDGAALPLDEHHLVNFSLEFAEERYDEDQAVHHGLLRFRAVTQEGQ